MGILIQEKQFLNLNERYTYNGYDDQIRNTYGGNRVVIKIALIEGINIIDNIWDIIDYQFFRYLNSIFTRSSQGMIIVYDISKDNSFEELNYFCNELNQILLLYLEIR